MTPNTGSGEHDRGPATMPALGGAAALPLRFLDFLIHEPVRAVLLHGAGVPVLVPAPNRFAVHKLIVAARRQIDRTGAGKSQKDLRQASALILAYQELRRAAELTEAYAEAWGRGPSWREAISRSVQALDDAARPALHDLLRAGARQLGLPATELARPASD